MQPNALLSLSPYLSIYFCCCVAFKPHCSFLGSLVCHLPFYHLHIISISFSTAAFPSTFFLWPDLTFSLKTKTISLSVCVAFSILSFSLSSKLSFILSKPFVFVKLNEWEEEISLASYWKIINVISQNTRGFLTGINFFSDEWMDIQRNEKSLFHSFFLSWNSSDCDVTTMKMHTKRLHSLQFSKCNAATKKCNTALLG